MRKVLGLRLPILVGVVALCLSGCAPITSGGGPGKAEGGSGSAGSASVSVVASVRVWADIAQVIGGKYVAASAVVALPGQDPHSYQTTVRDQLAVNRADITITNGGGYDPFFAQLVANKPRSSAAAGLNLVARLKSAHLMVDPNPHLWYDLEYVRVLAGVIGRTEAAATKNPAAQTSILANTANFQRGIRALAKQQQALMKRVVGKPVLVTEPFASRMLRHLALIDDTPVEFKNAVEQEQDASPKVMREMQLRLASHRVSLLLVNLQTEGSQTNQLMQWAQESGVPVLALSEVLPAGAHYLGWMQKNLDEIARAIH